MKRGEIWTAASGKDYAGKPRPVVIVQDDRIEDTDSVTVCLMTSNPANAPLLRVLVEPDIDNGLRQPSRIMVDKIVTLPRTKVGKRVGVLSALDVARLNQAMLVFLGLAESPRSAARRR